MLPITLVISGSHHAFLADVISHTLQALVARCGQTATHNACTISAAVTETVVKPVHAALPGSMQPVPYDPAQTKHACLCRNFRTSVAPIRLSLPTSLRRK